MSDLLEQEEFEAHPMDEVITNLWIGNLSSAQDEETLKTHNIHSIVSAMRGKISIHEVRQPSDTGRT
ncbi:hypothetical protein A0H81_12556 [Grifola frondosa]|uniref:Uncharacterized protein n=1 Tax=Grifola frondosa TaxID=5627 RepID=A0A1C7LT26_GRIFR|nr:hypothetical protein A0H81_12556 [Grifola frondosa]